MAATIRPSPRWVVRDDSTGEPVPGALIHTYDPGTTDDKTTWQDSDKVTPHANPIVADDNGEFGPVYWDGQYRIYATDALGTPVSGWDIDNYGAGLGEDQNVLDNGSLIANGSFENDSDGDGVPDSWDVVEYPDAGNGAGVQSLITTDHYHGAQCMKFQSYGDGGGYMTTSAFVACSPGLDIEISWALYSSVADVRNRVEIIYYDEDQVLDSTVQLYDNTETNPTVWSQQVSTVNPPATARYFKIRAYGCHSSDATPGITYYDDFRAVVTRTRTGIGQIIAVTGNAHFY